MLMRCLEGGWVLVWYFFQGVDIYYKWKEFVGGVLREKEAIGSYF